MRRLLAHIQHLPEDSALVRKRQGDFRGWSMDSELLATNADLLQQLVRVQFAANGQNPPDFVAIPRPYSQHVEPEPETAVSVAEGMNFLKDW